MPANLTNGDPMKLKTPADWLLGISVIGIALCVLAFGGAFLMFALATTSSDIEFAVTLGFGAGYLGAASVYFGVCFLVTLTIAKVGNDISRIRDKLLNTEPPANL